MVDPHMILSFTHEADPFAFTVIDTLTCMTSSGGVRIYEDVDLEEVKLLAREMSLKFGFIGLPRGGAKSCLRIHAEASIPEKLALCEKFGRRLAPIIHTGLYYPGMDMNCGPDELRAIYRGAGLELGSITDSSFFTAVSVAASMAAVREYLQVARPLTVAIEGFGSVAAHLASRLPEDQFRVVAVSTRDGAVGTRRGFAAAELVSLRHQYGDAFVRHVPGGETLALENVLSADVDIFVPAARVHSINENTVRLVRAQAVVPVANAPFTSGALAELHARGVICLPGFVSNSGGVFASGLYDSGVPIGNIEAIASGLFCKIVFDVLVKSSECAISPVTFAEQLALFRQKESGAIAAGYGEALFRKLRHRGILPRAVAAARAERKFVRNLHRLAKQIREFQQ